MAETPDQPHEMRRAAETTDPDRPRRILAQTLLDALAEAGIIREKGEYIRRVVIDAEVGNAVRIYVERFGDDRLIRVAQTLAGVEISGVPA
jgi:hypothetical protein